MNQDFKDITSCGFMKHNGGLEFRKISDSDYEFKTTIQEYHLNSGGITHGGFIMSLLDTGMGSAAHRILASNTRIATITFDVKFISASTAGDTLVGSAKVLKQTRFLCKAISNAARRL
jgi:uncharacterized protein (TIGR00369 family)